jgi:hypothetical protein
MVVLPLLLLPSRRSYLRNQCSYFGLLPVLPVVSVEAVDDLLFLLFLLFFPVVVLSDDIFPELEPALDEPVWPDEEPVWPDEEPVCEPAWAKVNGDTATAKAKVRMVFLILDLLAGSIFSPLSHHGPVRRDPAIAFLGYGRIGSDRGHLKS